MTSSGVFAQVSKVSGDKIPIESFIRSVASRHAGRTRAEEPSQRVGQDERGGAQSAAQERHDERHLRRPGERRRPESLDRTVHDITEPECHIWTCFQKMSIYGRKFREVAFPHF